MELLSLPIDKVQVLPGHNARQDLGDLAELAASIRANGVLQPLTVVELPAVGADKVYGLVAGERRLAAARQAGLVEVPCLVRQDLDEQRRAIAMLGENLQRQDLSALEEASGIQRLAAMGLSQRQIAAELGCSQGHVSKRLSLLELPEPIRQALGADSGGITVGDALQLAKLNDQPERQAAAFREASRFRNAAAAVRQQLEEVAREKARAEARARLQSAGVKVLKEEPYYNWYSRGEKPLRGCGEDYNALALSEEEHRQEPCHAAASDGRGRVIYVCRQPERHGAAGPSAAEQARRRQEREHARAAREAAAARAQVMERLLARPASTATLSWAIRQVLAAWRQGESKLACRLLEIEPPRTKWGGQDWSLGLAEHAAGGAGQAQQALLALALAGGEDRLRSEWDDHTGIRRRHLEFLVQAGYQAHEHDARWRQESSDAVALRAGELERGQLRELSEEEAEPGREPAALELEEGQAR